MASDRLAFWGTRIGMQLAVMATRILPRPIIFSTSHTVARIGFYLFHGFRSRSVKNLTVALGSKFSKSEIREIAQRSLRNFICSFTEIPIALASHPDELRDTIPFRGREHLDAALGKGKGVILLSGHLGNFILLGTRLALSGYPTHVLINQRRDGRFAQLMDEYRKQVLQTTIHARPRREALRQLVRVLRHNDIVVIIADEYRKGNDGVRVPFFGRAVLARRGPVTLALRTGAAVVPAFLIREADNRLTLVVERELELIRTQRDKTAIAENTLRITQWLERTVRLYPDQWNWMTVNWQDGPGAPPIGNSDRVERLSVWGIRSRVSGSRSPTRDPRRETRH
jgi:Kdo2-lipid IVA lauroyltransferase/acyltransferase